MNRISRLTLLLFALVSISCQLPPQINPELFDEDDYGSTNGT